MQLTMGIIKIEVSVPEAVQALEEFRKNRIQALDAISGEIRTAVASAFNTFLNTEMSLFLGRPDQSDNKRNGYQEREYALKGVGCLRIRMPVDRRRKFESAVVPHREQIDPRLKEEMAILHLAGLSTRTMAMVSKRVLGVEVSTDNPASPTSLGQSSMGRLDVITVLAFSYRFITISMRSSPASTGSFLKNRSSMTTRSSENRNTSSVALPMAALQRSHLDSRSPKVSMRLYPWLEFGPC